MILFVIYECCVKLINNCISNSRFDWGMGGGGGCENNKYIFR